MDGGIQAGHDGTQALFADPVEIRRGDDEVWSCQLFVMAEILTWDPRTASASSDFKPTGRKHVYTPVNFK